MIIDDMVAIIFKEDSFNINNLSKMEEIKRVNFVQSKDGNL